MNGPNNNCTKILIPGKRSNYSIILTMMKWLKQDAQTTVLLNCLLADFVKLHQIGHDLWQKKVNDLHDRGKRGTVLCVTL